METQNYTCCKRNYSYIAVFLHFTGTNHIIAGSCLSIGKAGVYSKKQDKKKKKKKKIKDRKARHTKEGREKATEKRRWS